MSSLCQVCDNKSIMMLLLVAFAWIIVFTYWDFRLYIKQASSAISIVDEEDSEPEWVEYKIKETNMFTVDKYQQVHWNLYFSLDPIFLIVVNSTSGLVNEWYCLVYR